MDLLGTYAAQARDMGEWVRDAEINTDRNLRLQYLAGLALDRALSDELFDDILTCYKFPDNLFEGTPLTMEALKRAMEQPRHRK